MISKRFSRKALQFFLCFLDLLCALLSIWLTLFIRNAKYPTYEYWWQHVKIFTPLFLFAICFMYLEGLYIVFKPITNHIILLKYSILIIFGFLSGFVYFYFSLNQNYFPKVILLIFWFVFSTLSFLVRKLINFILLKRRLVSVIFLGKSNSYEKLIAKLNANPMYGFKPIFLYKNQNDKDELNKVIVSNQNNNVIYVFKHIPHIFDDINETIYELIYQSNQCIEYSQFYEYIERKIPIEDIGDSWFIKNVNLSNKRIYFIFKRFSDILLSLVGLLLTIWFCPLIAIIIKFKSPGPVFFIQTRLGLKGKEFQLLKFRTMFITDNNGSATQTNDKRITKFGKFLRSTRLDEIPQLINVLKGDMSIIGPRPERPELAEKLEKEVPWFKQRLFIRPGITGWDQVCGEYHSPSKEDTFKKLQNDLYYIKNCSFWLDISILFKTIYSMIKKEGQ